MQTKEDDYKIMRKEARTSLLELSSDDNYHALIVEEGLVRVPLIGSSAYEAFQPQPHSWPSFPDGSEIQRSSRPSKYGATELLLGLSVNEKKTEPDEAKINAMIGFSSDGEKPPPEIEYMINQMKKHPEKRELFHILASLVPLSNYGELFSKLYGSLYF